jgi:hypothetical protein
MCLELGSPIRREEGFVFLSRKRVYRALAQQRLPFSLFHYSSFQPSCNNISGEDTHRNWLGLIWLKTNSIELFFLFSWLEFLQEVMFCRYILTAMNGGYLLAMLFQNSTSYFHIGQCLCSKQQLHPQLLWIISWLSYTALSKFWDYRSYLQTDHNHLPLSFHYLWSSSLLIMLYITHAVEVT